MNLREEHFLHSNGSFNTRADRRVCFVTHESAKNVPRKWIVELCCPMTNISWEIWHFVSKINKITQHSGHVLTSSIFRKCTVIGHLRDRLATTCMTSFSWIFQPIRDWNLLRHTSLVHNETRGLQRFQSLIGCLGVGYKDSSRWLVVWEWASDVVKSCPMVF